MKTVLAILGKLIHDQSSKIPDKNNPQIMYWLNIYMKMFIFFIFDWLSTLKKTVQCEMLKKWRSTYNLLITIINISENPLVSSNR